jgi:hypothetical protein
MAGEREVGVLCTNCSAEIVENEPVGICRDCGAVHHQQCWEQRSGCCSYECGSEMQKELDPGDVPLTITREELAVVVPLPTRAPTHNFDQALENKRYKKWNRVSLWAFAIALLGIPLFGLITGLIAVLFACIALVTHHENRRGFGLAVVAMLIGLLDVVGWAVAMSHYWGTAMTAVSLAEMTIDPASLNELPDYLARAMRANVLIEINAGFGRGGIGSGVVLKISPEAAYIVTNRHVVDHNYSDSTVSVPKNISDLAPVMIRSVSQIAKPGIVEWVAPHGIDLAIVSTSLTHEDVQEARWNIANSPHIGESVFAVGNPHGLGWTHTSGSVSQIRRQSRQGFSYRVLQTSAAINPGNSGGGLYDTNGNLLGINTLTTEKRFAEGLGFSIALETLLEVIPDRFGIAKQNTFEPAAELSVP